MSAEDYDDVPGFGGGFHQPRQPKAYTCNFCKEPISFSNRKPFNKDGTPHRCKSKVGANPAEEITKEQPQATLFAMAAMNAIISAQIQAGGVDYIHHMNFYDVADASWRIAAAMIKSEKQFQNEMRFA